MRLIAGLGNPGERYVLNRHNVGFMFMDELSYQVCDQEWSFDRKLNSLIIKKGKTIFAKPQSYMNSSGNSMSNIVRHYKLETPDIWIIHDDLDLKIGEYKIQRGKGPKVHKGILSIEKKLGDNNFWRVRIGIDNRQKKIDNGAEKIPGEDYVLKNFSKDEFEIINEVIDKVAGELKGLLNL